MMKKRDAKDNFIGQGSIGDLLRDNQALQTLKIKDTGDVNEAFFF